MKLAATGYLKRAIEFTVYSNIWIACCALSMFWLSKYRFTSTISFSPLAAFVFFSTLFLYSLHRLSDIKKGDRPIMRKDRYMVISKHKKLFSGIAIIALVFSLALFFLIEFRMLWVILPPVVISLGYAIPFLTNNRRLRDIPFLKIILVSFTWSWVSVVIPAMQARILNQETVLLLFFERFFFVFAITIPFDVRDADVDKQAGVKSLPHIAGVNGALHVAMMLLFMAGLSATLSFLYGQLSPGSFAGLLLSFLIAAIVVQASSKKNQDLYFSGVIDGLMILHFFLVLLPDLFNLL